MRDTPSLLPAPTGPSPRPSKPRYMQFLSLSHYHTHGFIYASLPAEKPFHPPNAASPTPSATPIPPGTNASPAPGSSQEGSETDISPMLMTTVPQSSYTTLFQHVTYACQPFWCHRLTVTVQNGVFYDVGDFRVRLGDVRQTYPTNRVRGTVVEIEWRGPSVFDALSGAVTSNGNEDAGPGVDASLSALEESDVDAEFSATALLIREFWARLGVEGAREAILVPGVGTELKQRLAKAKSAMKSGREPSLPGAGLAGQSEDDPDPQAGADVARQYMEVLRFNR